ncbi:MCE family protein [Nocardioides sp. TRM66260-LWL]|uniref:MCE family protein n=1 Tax=Nocardioides sp. TRM66260-LWL TaxID=2874478 RepID=UPI001CC42C3C|nr:MlaD family protein [Nocardioides sp. TRM66260-LWL]MBZ5732995.1 MCE family protein [Nocardioides sp. TRM66260-LWL]
MILTRFVRGQLVVFAVLAAVSLAFVALVYGRVPERAGLGHYDVAADFGDASGLYPQANVTYRGVTVGRVTSLDLRPDGVRVHMRLSDDARVPADVSVQLHSTSAIGEQYVDLVPPDDRGPYLADGAVVPRRQTRPMPQITPVLDRLDRLLASVPRAATTRVLDQVDTGLGGAGDDLGGLVDASDALLQTAQSRLDDTRSLIAAADPTLRTQEALAPQTTAASSALAAFTRQLAASDDDLGRLLGTSPGSLASVRTLLDGLRPTLPTLLANLGTVGEPLTDYQRNLQQLAVVYPALTAKTQEALFPRASVGDARLDLRVEFNDPGSCIAGYTAPAARRSPSDLSSRRPPAQQYCRLPADAPQGVRGSRNAPCPNSSARGATPEACGLRYGGATRRGLAQTPIAAAPGASAEDRSAILVVTGLIAQITQLLTGR